MGPPKERSYPCQEFVKVEWLDKIVIGANFEPCNTLGHGIARRQHQDRKPVVGVFGSAYATSDLDAIDFRQHQVQDDQVWRAIANHFQRRATRRRNFNFVPLEQESTADKPRDGWFVLHDKDALGTR